METVDTVAFILMKDGKILVEKRRLDKETDPGKVVIPGGHIEDGESHKQALQRELYEELRITCNNFTFIARMPCETETEIQMNHWYLCNNWTGTPTSSEAEEIYYITDPDQLDLPNDKAVITTLLKSLR